MHLFCRDRIFVCVNSSIHIQISTKISVDLITVTSCSFTRTATHPTHRCTASLWSWTRPTGCWARNWAGRSTTSKSDTHTLGARPSVLPIVTPATEPGEDAHTVGSSNLRWLTLVVHLTEERICSFESFNPTIALCGSVLLAVHWPKCQSVLCNYF